MATPQRRCDRIMLMVRLRIQRADATGNQFEEEARAITVNRHGARIRTRVTLRAGQIVRLTNVAAKRDAEFRVVGPVAPPSDGTGDWGVECLSPDYNIWGIKFP